MFVETNLPLRHFNFKLSLLQCFLQGNPTPVVLSHQTPSTYLLFSIANGTWSVHISLLFQTRQPQKAMNWGLFLAGSSVLKLNILIDLFLTNTQLVNYYSSCKLYILILMAPIHCRGSTGKLCNVTFFQISPNEETRHFSTFFLVNYSFRAVTQPPAEPASYTRSISPDYWSPAPAPTYRHHI